MKRLALVVPWLLGCSGGPAPAPLAPIASLETPPASTLCYTGLRTGMGQTARTIARRTLDPAARQITEAVTHHDEATGSTNSFEVVMTIDGDAFTMAEASGAVVGAGTLTGEPWRWTSWTSTARLANGLTVESAHAVTPTGLTATKQITQAGAVVATTTEELTRFECAAWDEARSALTVAVLDLAACERACRNFATLKFWDRAEAELATLPPAERAAARSGKESRLAEQLATGVDACAAQCLAAGNAVQTACMGRARSMDALAACE